MRRAGGRQAVRRSFTAGPGENEGGAGLDTGERQVEQAVAQLLVDGAEAFMRGDGHVPVLPALAVAGGAAATFLFARRRLGASRLEATQAVFILLATGFALLTVAGIFFRGPGMRLMFPWRT